MIIIGIAIGIPIGAIALFIGIAINDDRNRRRGNYDYCEYCGKKVSDVLEEADRKHKKYLGGG